MRNGEVKVKYKKKYVNLPTIFSNLNFFLNYTFKFIKKKGNNFWKCFQADKCYYIIIMLKKNF